MGSLEMFSNLSLTAALFLGALHAFWPGHGKAILAAFLIGSRGRVIHAIWLGLIIAITHTFTIIALGIIVKLAYGAIMTAVAQPQTPDAEPITVPGAKIMQLIAGALIIIVGIWLIMGRNRIHSHGHHDHHDHHDHEAEDHQGMWRILLLGISGGMVPCAEGMALLLMAIAAGQTGRGLALVLAFSLGVAIVIITIGIMVCKLTSVAEHLFQRTGKWVHRLPVISGSLIVILGCYSVVRVLITL